MNMAKCAAFPYILFAAAFVVLDVLFAAATYHLHVQTTIYWLAYLVAASISLLVALRFGRINYRSLFTTTCVLSIAMVLVILGLLESIARQTPGGHVDVSHFFYMLGWRPIALSLSESIGAPLLALFFIRRLRPAHVAV